MKKPHPDAASLRSTVRQAAKRAHYHADTINAIVDEALVATVSLVDQGHPIAIPMAIARIDDAIYLHGSQSSRLMQRLASGEQACLTITHLDGVVVSRSGMHCSMNYRSVVVHGCGELVADADKATLLDQVVESIIPNSRGDYRDHLPKELKATCLVRFPLTEAVAKIRQGGPIDDDEDLDLPYWAGEIPMQVHYGTPVDADNLPDGVATPAYATHYQRPSRTPHSG